jgi:hypothetical protein
VACRARARWGCGAAPLSRNLAGIEVQAAGLLHSGSAHWQSQWHARRLRIYVRGPARALRRRSGRKFALADVISISRFKFGAEAFEEHWERPVHFGQVRTLQSRRCVRASARACVRCVWHLCTCREWPLVHARSRCVVRLRLMQQSRREVVHAAPVHLCVCPRVCGSARAHARTRTHALPRGSLARTAARPA